MTYYGYIYKITQISTGKTYIGQRMLKWDKPNKVYMGSGSLMRRSLKKHGLDDFSKDILEYCTSKKELNEREIYYINLHQSIFPNGLNLSKGGTAGGTLPLSVHPDGENIRKKQSESRKKYMKTEPEHWKEKRVAGIKKHLKENKTGCFMDPLLRAVSCSKGGKITGKMNAESGHLLRISQDPVLKERRKEKMRNKRWYNNGVKNLMLEFEETPPEGYVRGMLREGKVRKPLQMRPWYLIEYPNKTVVAHQLAQVAAILGVTRQIIWGYLKGENCTEIKNLKIYKLEFISISASEIYSDLSKYPYLAEKPFNYTDEASKLYNCKFFGKDFKLWVQQKCRLRKQP